MNSEYRIEIKIENWQNYCTPFKNKEEAIENFEYVVSRFPEYKIRLIEYVPNLLSEHNAEKEY